MSELSRFGISIERGLLDKFDRLIRRRKYTNRSEAFRDLIRQELVKTQWNQGSEVAGAITLIYGHHKRDLLNKVMDIQHEFQNIILSTQHIHLSHDTCLEIVAVRGSAARVQDLADTLTSAKGVRHGTLSMSTTGQDIQ